MANSSMISVSLCAIVRNEASRIVEFLEHVREDVDEMIIVDTGSSDDTVAMAREHGATVLEMPWCDDFSESRNHALNAAVGDWILVLDADERLDVDAVTELKKRCGDQCPQVVGLLFDVRNYVDESRDLSWRALPEEEQLDRGFDGYLPSQVVRMFRNDPAIRYEGRVHELVEPAIERMSGKIIGAECIIHHQLREQQDDAGRTKGERYLELLQKKACDDPQSAKAHWELGLQALGQGYLQRGVAALQTAWELSPGNLEIGAALALAWNDLGQPTKALRILRALGAPEHSDPRINYELGRALFLAGDDAHACTAFERAHAAAPHLQQPLYWLARATAPKNPEAALAYLEQRRALVDDAPGRLLEAELLLRVGNTIAGRDLCEAAALAVTTDTPGDGWDQLVQYLDTDHPELLQATLATLALTPSTGAPLAAWLESRHCDRAAAQLYAALIDYNEPDNDWLLRRAHALRRCGEEERARCLLEELTYTDSHRAAAHYGLAQLRLGDGDLNEAAQQLSQALQCDPTHTAALIDLAGLHGNSGRPELAFELLQAALAQDPTNPLIHHNLGVAALVMTPPDPESARRHLRQAVELGHPVDPTVMARLAELTLA
ncbi:MAG: glycosyltransferase [Planctomycetota bacterium]